MESLSKTLQPHKELIGTVAGIVTIGQFLSGAVLCRDIYRKGTTRGISSTPFVGSIAVGILMIQYALLLGDPAMLQVNIAAVFLNVIYTVFYYMYSPNKSDDIYKPMSYGTLLVAVFLGYASIESDENLEYRYGMLVTILMLMLLGAPLADLKQIISRKDASSIPLPLTLMGTLVTFLWFIYGIILLNNFMIVQNVIGFALCVVQLVLYVMYPGMPEVEMRENKDE